MTQLVEDLLFLARHDARATEMPLERVDLDDLLRGVCAALTGIAGLRQVRIRYRNLANRPCPVSVNAPALRRLFLVLLDNAIKYSRPDSDVIVELSTDRQSVAVTVEDFGIGISEADLPHIFERFYQADKARTDRGFGLGLSLAESIVLAHGATIDVTSTVGVGSKFRVLLRTPDSGLSSAADQNVRAHSPEIGWRSLNRASRR